MIHYIKISKSLQKEKMIMTLLPIIGNMVNESYDHVLNRGFANSTIMKTLKTILNPFKKILKANVTKSNHNMCGYIEQFSLLRLYCEEK